MKSTFASRFAADLIAFAARSGVPETAFDQILERWGHAGLSETGRIDALCMADIWQEAQRLTGDPYLAFHMAVEFAFSANRTPSLIMQSCETVLESFEMGMKYGELIANVFTMKLANRGENLTLDYIPDDRWKNVPQDVLNDSICATLVSCLNSLQMCLGKFVSPSVLDFQFPRPQNTNELFATFNSSIGFCAPSNRIGFPADVSGMPIATQDNGLLRTLRQYGDELKLEIVANSKPGVIADTRRQLLDQISPHSEVSVDAVAQAMNMTVRTLQRRLKNADVSFQQLLDEARSRLAVRHLRGGEKSIDEIGYLLGYSETTSFARAFRRWYGKSPRQYLTDRT